MNKNGPYKYKDGINNKVKITLPPTQKQKHDRMKELWDMRHKKYDMQQEVAL